MRVLSVGAYVACMRVLSVGAQSLGRKLQGHKVWGGGGVIVWGAKCRRAKYWGAIKVYLTIKTRSGNEHSCKNVWLTVNYSHLFAFCSSFILLAWHCHSYHIHKILYFFVSIDRVTCNSLSNLGSKLVAW